MVEDRGLGRKSYAADDLPGWCAFQFHEQLDRGPSAKYSFYRIDDQLLDRSKVGLFVFALGVFDRGHSHPPDLTEKGGCVVTKSMMSFGYEMGQDNPVCCQGGFVVRHNLR